MADTFTIEAKMLVISYAKQTKTLKNENERKTLIDISKLQNEARFVSATWIKSKGLHHG